MQCKLSISITTFHVYTLVILICTYQQECGNLVVSSIIPETHHGVDECRYSDLNDQGGNPKSFPPHLDSVSEIKLKPYLSWKLDNQYMKLEADQLINTLINYLK